MSGFPNLQPKQSKHQSHEGNDDGETLIDGSSSKPSHLVYVPGESQLSHDGTTLFDGVEGSSSLGFGQGTPFLNQQHINASLQQLKYNDNKLSLDRSINQTIELIEEIIKENKERPVG